MKSNCIIKHVSLQWCEKAEKTDFYIPLGRSEYELSMFSEIQIIMV